jgi:hypothetical protein
MSNARPPNPFNLCSFQFADGRCCGLPAHSKGEGLCLVHYRRLLAAEKPRDDDLSRELASPSGDFMRQFDIHHILGALFKALAAKRVTPRRATSLAYIAFLIAQSQKAAKAEARNYDEEIPIFKRWLDVKYPGLAEQFAAWEIEDAKAGLSNPKSTTAAAATASTPNPISAPPSAPDSPASDSLAPTLADIPTESLTIS